MFKPNGDEIVALNLILLFAILLAGAKDYSGFVLHTSHQR